MDLLECTELNMNDDKLKQLVHVVQSYLKSIDSLVPFYICGGCVYGTVNSTFYNDIDVYFYTEQDRDKVTDKIIQQRGIDAKLNVNAVQVYFRDPGYEYITHKLQFVKCVHGDVHDVMSTFDLNCCKIAYTSCNKLIKSVDYTQHVSVDEKNIKSSIFGRFKKYRDRCGSWILVNLEDDDVYKQIIKFIVHNFNVSFGTHYGSDTPVRGYNLLKKEAVDVWENQIIHDCALSMDAETRIHFFSNMHQMWYIDIQNMCDELYLFAMLQSRDRSKYQSPKYADRQSVLLKYPEYFI